MLLSYGFLAYFGSLVALAASCREFQISEPNFLSMLVPFGAFYCYLVDNMSDYAVILRACETQGHTAVLVC